MNAGPLKERIQIEERVTMQDEFGQPVETWLPYTIVYASIEPLAGREYFTSQQMAAEVTTRIRIRYQDQITTRMRALHAGRLYNIKSVIDPKLRHEELELMCTEGVGDGG